VFLAIPLLLAPAIARAHDTWLLPARFSVPVPGTIELALTSSGGGFPASDHAVEEDRLVADSCLVAGETVTLARRQGERALHLSGRAVREGVAACTVETKPRTLELTAKQVEEYFDEADIAASVRESWKAMPKGKRWRESYVKHAKTFVRVGEPSPGLIGWAPLGAALELAPETDPTAFHAGDEAAFRLMRNGAPRAGLVVAAVSEKGGKPIRATADGEGRILFRFPAAGRWLLRVVDIQPAEQPDLEWESHFATLVLSVQ
jgi:hypothetical protein